MKVSKNNLVAKAGGIILLIFVISFLVFLISSQVIKITSTLNILILIIVGSSISLIFISCILKYCLKDSKEELLHNMDVFHEAGFTLVLTVVVLGMTILEPGENNDFFELNLLLAMLPYTIFIMARKMKGKNPSN